jgi:hypothetical protein
MHPSSSALALALSASTLAFSLPHDLCHLVGLLLLLVHLHLDDLQVLLQL